MAAAQAPPVPPTFQDLYTELDNYLINFNTTLSTGGGGNNPVLWSGSLKSANGNVGPQLINNQPGVLLQLQALKAMGAKSIMVQVGFPVLWEPFLTSQGQSYASFASFYQGVATAVKQAGLKLIVENDTLLSDDVQAGWGTAAFYATLNWTQYQQARAQMALAVAQLMQPDYMVVIEEPGTESRNTGQTQANTPTGSASLLSTILASTSQSGVTGMKVGAGVITTQSNAIGFIQQYVILPVDFIDMHIYPVNNTYLPIALQIATTAAVAGKPVSMSECWLTKVRDSEIGVVPMDTIRARDPFSFWAPLDAYFVQTMEKLANYTQMIFMDPFGSEYFFSYQPYNDANANLPPADILNQENASVFQANQQGLYTSTGLSYYHSMVTIPDTTPPSVPTGLSGLSGNPDMAAISWTAATDNVGVAGYYVFRNGTKVGQAATLYYQDTGLTEATTYTYTLKAFDLAGFVSALSAPVNVQTTNVTPPTTPGNEVATAVSCYRATVTWSPSTDNTGVTEYLLYWGLSPGSLTQVAIVAGTTLSYSNGTLSPDTTNYFAVQAEDKNHNISNMSAVAAVTTPKLPLAPTGVLATPVSATKITVTWAASTGGLTISHYNVYRGTSSSNLSQVAQVAKTTYTDTSVAAATKYYYAVQAADSGTPPAISGLSSTVSATTYTPPSAPTNLTATAFSTSQVALQWSAPASGGLPIQHYFVYRGTSTSNLTQLAVDPQTGYVDATVTPAAKYYYAIAAGDTGGDLSPMTTPVAVTIPSPPSAPTNLAATALSTTRIGLTWTAAKSGGLPVQNYHVLRGTTASNLSPVATVLQASYTDASGSPATTYYYAVQAVDSGGDLSPQSTIVKATTLALPSAPTSLTATAPSNSTVNLAWTAAKSGMPLVSYTIYRGSSASNLTSLQVVSASRNSYTDNSVSASTTYYYGIAATDTGGNVSPMSNVVHVTMPK